MGVTLTRNELPRDLKLLIDSGLQPQEAARKLSAARLGIVVTPEVARSRVGQIAVVIAVATAIRSHHGGVIVDVPDDVGLAVRWSRDVTTLAGAVRELGASVGAPAPEFPIIAIGNGWSSRAGVRVVLDGTRAGCSPLTQSCPFDCDGFALGAVMGSSLAVLAMFRRYLLDQGDAGSDDTRIDLLGGRHADVGTLEMQLPSRLAFLGTGHLGQAALLAASLIGPPDDTRTYLLHDNESVVKANPSTQLLVGNDEGQAKTSVCEQWLKRRGINAATRSDSFGTHSRVRDQDPPILIAGLHDGETRRALEAAGYAFIVDAAIGAGHQDYTCFKVHTFPASRRAEDVFLRTSPLNNIQRAIARADRYASFPEAAADECGARDVAGAAVGVPFVGTAIAAISLAEVLFYASGMTCDEIITGDLAYTGVVTARAPNMTVKHDRAASELWESA